MRQAKPGRLETAPTGGRKCLFIFRIHYNMQITVVWTICVALPVGQVSRLDSQQHVGWVERPHPIRSNNLKAVKTHETHYSVIVSETQLQRYLPLSPIGPVVGVGFLLFFLRRSYLRKGRSFYVHTVWLWLSVQPNLRKIV